MDRWKVEKDTKRLAQAKGASKSKRLIFIADKIASKQRTLFRTKQNIL